MTNASLQHFCNRIIAAGAISLEDVRELNRAVLPDGLTCRDEADMLFGLDRAIPGADETFGDWLVAAIVDFAVWGERPTGHIDADTAHWLAASLGCGRGPTAIGARIAVEVVREAETNDPVLISFALKANRARAGAEDAVEEILSYAVAA
ncbi:hypothetical protein [Methylobacterium frigidaeris]|jgi:hypothetical protein|uniref:Uncharacterized protein n=1 Tax=Methylobacterium frigidaeris TaxID=2038277 RepID=A0AA37HF92_9HYPH|nr:hypothetical protein [Methylobacterium frigidaeris]PIK71886.1 hypothetical protein CS379_16975 [Methylobacterium frigidaeris]GJD64805.1 hypothetical protein MPEAHAMD_4990 [Methylobacterium frigidaeris]